LPLGKRCAPPMYGLKKSKSDFRQPKTGRSEERSIFRLGALASSGDDEHVEVQQLRERRRIARRNDELNEQQLPILLHRPTAVPQERDTPVIVETLDDMRKEVGVAAFPDRLEEVARHRFAARGESSGFDVLLRVLDHGRGLEEDARHVRVGLQDHGQQKAIPTADVNDLVNPENG
jgi:hypothetical protein